MGLIRNRIPKLAGPEKHTAKFYASFRDADGRAQKIRFTRDRKESERLYRRWIVENYDNTTIISQEELEDKQGFIACLPLIADAYVQAQAKRVRPDEAPRKQGTISVTQFYAIKKFAVNVVAWMHEHFGERLGITSFSDLVDAEDYNLMMLDFTHRFSTSQISKHRNCFWDLARFARTKPFEQRLRFSREDVRPFGGGEQRRERAIPTVDILRQILLAATVEEEVWIWMAIGLAFGNDDLARSKPLHFGSERYDLRRGKTGIERYGCMRPLVWAQLCRHLQQNPRKPDELLFVSQTGHSLVYTRTKTADEIKNGTRTHRPTPMPYVKVDLVSRKWRKLLERSGVVGWSEGFYVLRHLGATAFGTMPGISLNEMKRFLGHTTSQMADHYMRPLRPGVEDTVNWVNRMLQSADPDVWRSVSA